MWGFIIRLILYGKQRTVPTVPGLPSINWPFPNGCSCRCGVMSTTINRQYSTTYMRQDHETGVKPPFFCVAHCLIGITGILCRHLGDVLANREWLYSVSWDWTWEVPLGLISCQVSQGEGVQVTCTMLTSLYKNHATPILHVAIYHALISLIHFHKIAVPSSAFMHHQETLSIFFPRPTAVRNRAHSDQ